MSTSPASTMGVSEAVRSRNAQAQADLRARRKTYITQLEADNAQLAEENARLEARRRHSEEQIGLLRGQVKTLKESLGMRKTAATSTVDSLLAAVEVERSKVRRLRSAIRDIALMEAQDSDSDEAREESTSFTHRRKKARTSPSPCADLSGSLDAGLDLKHDSESVTTMTASSLSPPTPTQMDSISASLCSQPQIHTDEDQDSSRSALTLLLAQSSSFKRQVVDVLAHDLQATATAPMMPWSNHWQALPHSHTINTSRASLQLPLQNDAKVHDEILDRFLSSIAAPCDLTTRTGTTRQSIDNTAPFRPPRGQYCSASIFLVLFSLLLRAVSVGDREDGKKGIAGEEGRHFLFGIVLLICLIRTIWS